MKRKPIPLFGSMLTIAALGLAFWSLHHLLHQYHYRDVIHSLRQIPQGQMALALAFTAVSYLLLTFYDTLAVRIIGHPMPYHRIALASFIGYAFNNNFGFAGLAGNSLRYRIYSTWGLSAIDVAKVIFFCAMTFWLGFLTVAGVSFLLDPYPILADLPMRLTSLRPAGIALLIPVLAYLTWNVLNKAPVQIGNWSISLPAPRISVIQIVIATLDWAAAAAVFFVLLPGGGHATYFQILELFLLAQIAGLISHVPGGVGIFEAVMIYSLHTTYQEPQILGALLAYRAVYYLIPLGMAVVALGMHELALRSQRVQLFVSRLAHWLPQRLFKRMLDLLGHWVPLAGPRETVRFIGQWVPALVPNVFAFATFVAGALLLFSGATPGVGERLTFLNDYIPVPLIEAAHILASMIGASLLLLSRGLQRRLDSAYLVTVVLLTASIPFTLLKGFDYEEATVLLLILLAFIPCRPHFYRKTSMLNHHSISLGWAVAIALTIAGSMWLGMFSYKRVEYSHQLWIHFSIKGDASKFLRASVGAVGIVILYGLKVLLRPAPPESIEMSEANWREVRAIVEKMPRTYAWAAMLRDKDILLNRKGNAFIMYGIEGRSWVALGDPVAPQEEMEELAWQFRELSDAHGGWTVFYHVAPDHLPLYLDLGLVLLKLGEEALVPLDRFSLEGSAHKNLRQSHHKVARDGCRFQILPAEAVPALLPQLQEISNSWLQAKHTREKGFSLGFFDPPYLSELPLAIIHDAAGRMVAFANLWQGADKEELSIDMMRYIPTLHPGIMDYLFVELMLWGKAEGYRWFNLGMAPLSGLENRALAPLWTRVGAMIFRHGEHFYNFKGLRQYKEKFDPVWMPKYLASPGGIALPRVLTNIASLISRGLRGVVAK